VQYWVSQDQIANEIQTSVKIKCFKCYCETKKYQNNWNEGKRGTNTKSRRSWTFEETNSL